MVNPRDCWATPTDLVVRVQRWLGHSFRLDACAEADTAKAPEWYGPDHPDPARRDALAVDEWTAGLQRYEDAIWCNPPYSDVSPWLRRCAQAGKHIPVVAWVITTVCTRAYHAWGIGAQYALVTRGRTQFISRGDVTASSASVDTWGLVWLPTWHHLAHAGPTQIVPLPELQGELL